LLARDRMVQARLRPECLAAEGIEAEDLPAIVEQLLGVGIDRTLRFRRCGLNLCGGAAVEKTAGRNERGGGAESERGGGAEHDWTPEMMVRSGVSRGDWVRRASRAVVRQRPTCD